jgi:hypothetical protein
MDTKSFLPLTLYKTIGLNTPVLYKFYIHTRQNTDKLEVVQRIVTVFVFMNGYIMTHVIELLCYNWRFVNFWLGIWSRNWRFFIDVFDVCFYCLLMFSFCLFQLIMNKL